ncbi:MAG: low molecular weight protein arginine phosphatase [Bacilli bacterium]
MIRILYVCTGNTCRSPMAEYITLRLAKEYDLSDQIRVSSAGVAALPGAAMAPAAVSALARRGVKNAETHQARRATGDRIANADLILTMSTAHKETLVARYPEARDRIYTLLEYVSSLPPSTAADAHDGRGAPNNRSRGFDIADPFGGGDDVYELTATEIEGACRRLLDHLRTQLGKS